MKKIFTLITFIAALAVPAAAQQLSITPNNNAQNLADYITGTGITISNPTISCPTGASGIFTGGVGINLSLDSGVILTSGQVSQVTPINSTSVVSATNGGGGNTLLGSVANPPCFQYHDACVIEFDIVPMCDSVRLRYIFASDEYNFYASSLSDVFGFFVSGPNPAGGLYNNVPISLVPNTTTVAQVTQINNGTANAGPCVNCAYYINNELAFGGQPVAFAFNGLTTTLTAGISTVPGQTYHLVLGVQDCSDQILDTGVFLEAEGLTCPDTSLTVSASETEICAGETVTLFANGLINYNWTPTGITNPTTGPIVTATPTVTTTYTASGFNISGIFYTDSITITVHPAPVSGHITASGMPTPGSNVLCSGDSALLTLNNSFGTDITWLFSTNLTFWDTLQYGGQGDTLWFTGPLTTSTAFRAIVENGPCSDTSAPITITVVPSPVTNVNDAVICEGDSAQLNAYGGTTYLWNPPVGLSNNTIPNPKASPNQTRVYYVVVTNDYGCSTQDSAIVTVNRIPAIDFTEHVSLCPNDDGSIVITNTAGTPPFDFSLNGTPHGNVTSFTNLAPGQYTILIKDANDCASDTLAVITEYTDVDASFIADVIVGYIPLNVSFNNTSSGNIVAYSWDFGNGLSSTDQHTSTVYEAHGTYIVTMTAYGGDPRCMDTAMVTIDARGQSEIALPNVFSPNGDGINDQFSFRSERILEFHIVIFDRWGRKVFESNDINISWDGTRKDGGEASEGTYFYTIEYTSFEGIRTLTHGTVNLFR